MVIFHFSMAMEDLARVEDVIWIKAALDLPHKLDGAAEFLLKKRHFALSDTMLAGAGAVHGQSPGIQPRNETLRHGNAFGRLVVEQQQHVEIAVAGMADDRRQQPMGLYIR